jgi:Na+/melibiose symporter-like transporter
MFNPTFFFLEEGKKRIVDINFNVDLFMHFIILFSFLTILFIYLITKMKSDKFNNELGFFFNDIINKNTEKIKKEQSLLNPDKLYNKEDSTVKKHNDNLIRLILTINTLLWIFFIILILVLNYNCNSNLNLKKIIFENFIIFSIICFIEYLFFTKIAIKFIPIEPSLISKQFVDTLKEKFKSHNNLQSQLKSQIYYQTQLF